MGNFDASLILHYWCVSKKTTSKCNASFWDKFYLDYSNKAVNNKQ